MPSILDGIRIPDSIDELLQLCESTDSGKSRLTLLHKAKEGTYALLTKGVQEVRPECEIPVGVFVAAKPKGLEYYVKQGIVLRKRCFEEEFYFTVEAEAVSEKKEYLVPFKFTSEELPSVIVEKELETTLFSCFVRDEQRKLECIEIMGERGIAYAVCYELFGEGKKKTKEVKIESTTYSQKIQALLQDEDSPSVLLHPKEYYKEDKSKELLFIKNSFKSAKVLGEVLLLSPLLAVIPYSALVQGTKDKWDKKYNQVFGEKMSEKDEKKRVLGEFILAHPKAGEGLKRMIEAFKHGGNIITYAAQAGLTYAAYKHMTEYISYPLLGLTALSGLQMTVNMIRSNGRDSSGIISSFLERKLYNKL